MMGAKISTRCAHERHLHFNWEKKKKILNIAYQTGLKVKALRFGTHILAKKFVMSELASVSLRTFI